MILFHSDSQEELIFEAQIVKFAKDLKIDIESENSCEDLEFITSYITFIKFARIFVPEPGSCLSASVHKSGNYVKHGLKVLYVHIIVQPLEK